MEAFPNVPQRSPCLLQIESFFEFSDRLESVMAKAYIWRYSESPLEVKIEALTDIWAVFNLQGGAHYRIPALHASPQRLCLFRGLGASGDRDHDLGVRRQRHSVGFSSRMIIKCKDWSSKAQSLSHKGCLRGPILCCDV